MASATILPDLVVDAQGKVTLACPVSFDDPQRRGRAASRLRTGVPGTSLEKLTGHVPAGKPVPFPDRAAVSRDLEAMVKAAAVASTQWQFELPAAAPAIARLAVHFDVGGERRAGRPPQPISGFAGTAHAPVTTFVARDAPPAVDGVLRVGDCIAAPQKVVQRGAGVIRPHCPARPRCRASSLLGRHGRALWQRGWKRGSSVRALLDEAALDAVRQWCYQPTLMNGVPVPVRMTVTLNFTLSEP